MSCTHRIHAGHAGGISFSVLSDNRYRVIEIHADESDLESASIVDLLRFWESTSQFVQTFLEENPGWSVREGEVASL
jgi:hypothetical protein